MDGLATRSESLRAAELSWTVHPAAEKRALAAAVVAIAAVAALLVTRVGGSPFYGLAALVLLAVSLRAFFLPRTFGLDEQGAWEQGPLSKTRSIAWADVRRVSRHPGGLFLSERAIQSRWLPERGLFLRTGGRRDAVAAYVERRATAA